MHVPLAGKMLRINPDGWQSPVAKFLSDDERARATAVTVTSGGESPLEELEPQLANSVLGIGIVLSLLTVPLWDLLLGR